MRVPAAVVFACVLVSCGPPPLPASGVCKAETECEKGLKCLSFGISDNGVCSESISKTCTLACSTDGDCAALKGHDGQGGFVCFKTCPTVQATCGRKAK